jgi:hypothetical protein
VDPGQQATGPIGDIEGKRSVTTVSTRRRPNSKIHLAGSQRHVSAPAKPAGGMRQLGGDCHRLGFRFFAIAAEFVPTGISTIALGCE